MTTPQVAADLGRAEALRKARDLPGALAAYERILAEHPDEAEALSGRGAVLAQLGRTDDAIESLERAVRSAPTLTKAWFNLGLARRKAGRDEPAAHAWERVLELDPTHDRARHNLHVTRATTREAGGDVEGALADHRAALAHRPGDPDILNNLGCALQRAGRFREAIASFREALSAKPDMVFARANLGCALKDAGHADEAVDELRTAIAQEPQLVVAHQNLLLCLHYDERASPTELFEAHRAFGEALADPIARARALPRATPDHSAHRPLRVGYLSGDFRQHSVASFLAPILAAHDRERFEIFGYSNAPHPDETTEKLAGACDRFRDVRQSSDLLVAQQVRDDAIDVLVDLNGHSSESRVLVLAHRPAPVQMTYLGYPDTTGMRQVDGRITDAIADPPGCEALHTERLFHLAHGAWAFSPAAESPQVGPPPSEKLGHITFGSFNVRPKIGAGAIAAWARILSEMPGSTLLLKTSGLGEPGARQALSAQFQARGIAPQRILVAEWSPTLQAHLARYGEIDIALDTFPYNGTTTTCEALWMGVPVITLRGNTHAGRVGASLLSRVGQTDCIAKDEDEYVEMAVDLATDSARLASLRSSLRGTMQQSPLTDGAQLTQELEDAYRQAWLAYCIR